MTLYYSGPEDDRNDADWSPAESGKSQIIENHPEYVELTDDGELVLDLDEMYREEKLKTWVNCFVDAIRTSDQYDVEIEPTFRYVGEQ
jgi:hypothetical protein